MEEERKRPDYIPEDSGPSGGGGGGRMGREREGGGRVEESTRPNSDVCLRLPLSGSRGRSRWHVKPPFPCSENRSAERGARRPSSTQHAAPFQDSTGCNWTPGRGRTWARRRKGRRHPHEGLEGAPCGTSGQVLAQGVWLLEPRRFSLVAGGPGGWKGADGGGGSEGRGRREDGTRHPTLRHATTHRFRFPTQLSQPWRCHGTPASGTNPGFNSTQSVGSCDFILSPPTHDTGWAGLDHSIERIKKIPRQQETRPPNLRRPAARVVVGP